jgi:chromosome segregation ATPase
MASQISLSESGSDGLDALHSLDKLENRIQGAVSRFRDAEEKRAAAETEAQRLQGLFAEKDSEIERLKNEVEEMRAERVEVRGRIEALVDRIDSLDT